MSPTARRPLFRLSVGLGLALLVGAILPPHSALAQVPALPTLVGQPLAAGNATAPLGATLPSPISPQNGGEPSRPLPPDADLAFGAFQRGYFATAMSEAMKRVKANPKDGTAMALIAEIYAQGLAVNPDPAEAARWDRLASQQNNREATFAYGMALLQGKGVDKDRKAAAAQFERAAAQGHAGALYNLGVMAIEGEGATHDFGLAAAYFQRAANAGDIDALDALAALFKSGRGVAQNASKAAELLKRAADEKHPGAQVQYAIMLFNGDGVDKNEAEAARYFQMAANQGNPVAENRLARLYAAGRGLARNPVEAARWHILARAAGVADAWLDGQLAALSPADKAKVEDVVRRQLAR